MQKVKLGEIFELQMGKTPAREKLEYWNGEYNWAAIADLGKDKYINKTAERITRLAVNESGIKIVPENTVIMSFKLSIGKTAITSKPIYTNEAIMAFIDKKICQIMPEYIYYMFSSLNWTEGSNKAVKGITLNKATLQGKEICLHNLSEQIKIVNKLDKVTDLIEKRKKQIEKLDELVKSRFIEMFGDPNINNRMLLTDAMPNVCNIIDGDRGSSYPKQEELLTRGECLFLSAKNVTNEGFKFNDCVFISKEKDEKLRNGKLLRGDIVLTTRGTIGNLAYYSEKISFNNVRINSGMVILRVDTKLLNRIFFMQNFKLQLDEIKRKIANGSAQPQLPILMMKKINIMLPPIELQNKFAEFVEKMEKNKSAIKKSLSSLETLKKSLMQKYFG